MSWVWERRLCVLDLLYSRRGEERSSVVMGKGRCWELLR